METTKAIFTCAAMGDMGDGGDGEQNLTMESWLQLTAEDESQRYSFSSTSLCSASSAPPLSAPSSESNSCEEEQISAALLSKTVHTTTAIAFTAALLPPQQTPAQNHKLDYQRADKNEKKRTLNLGHPRCVSRLQKDSEKKRRRIERERLEAARLAAKEAGENDNDGAEYESVPRCPTRPPTCSMLSNMILTLYMVLPDRARRGRCVRSSASTRKRTQTSGLTRARVSAQDADEEERKQGLPVKLADGSLKKVLFLTAVLPGIWGFPGRSTQCWLGFGVFPWSVVGWDLGGSEMVEREGEEKKTEGAREESSGRRGGNRRRE
eukprot:338260-Rhodomonas_salina.1